MTCDETRPLLEEYTLGLLSGEDHARVTEHLSECLDCHRIALEYAELTARLPVALAVASGLRPPPEIREYLIQTLQADAEQPQSRSEPGGSVQRHEADLPDESGAGSRLLRSPWWNRRRLALAATIALLVVSLGWSVRLNQALSRERALRAEFADLVGQQEIVFEIVDSNETNRVILRPLASDSESRSYGKLFTRSDFPDVVVMAGRLPVPPEGESYHLWVTKDHGTTEFAGVVTVNAEGFGLLIFEADENGPVYDSVWLTLQPEEAPAPVGSPVLIWESSG